MHKCVWYLWTCPDITTFEWWRGNYYEREVDNDDNDDNEINPFYDRVSFLYPLKTS